MTTQAIHPTGIKLETNWLLVFKILDYAQNGKIFGDVFCEKEARKTFFCTFL